MIAKRHRLYNLYTQLAGEEEDVLQGHIYAGRLRLYQVWWKFSLHYFCSFNSLCGHLYWEVRENFLALGLTRVLGTEKQWYQQPLLLRRMLWVAWMNCINRLCACSQSSSVQLPGLDKATGKQPLLSSPGSQTQRFLHVCRTSNCLKINK